MSTFFMIALGPETIELLATPPTGSVEVEMSGLASVMVLIVDEGEGR